MNKTTKIYLIALLSAIMVCLLTTPVMADYNFDGFPVQTRTSGIVNGGVFFGYEPWDGTTTLTGNFDVPNGDVKWARLYTGIWGSRKDYAGWVNVTFNDVCDRKGLGPIHLKGENDDNSNVWCSGCGKHRIYYDVTDLVTAGATNTATTSKINETVGSFDGRVYGIVLVVVYEGGDSPKDIQYWINDGSDGLNYITPHNEGTTYFDGVVDTGIVTDAKLTMVHLTAYDPLCANCLKFNDNPLDTNMVDSNTFELNTWDVTSYGYVASSGNNAWYTRGEDGYVSVCNAILVLEREAVEKPDLNVTSISVNCDCLSGNESNEICAIVKNNGAVDAGSFDISFNVDGFSEEVRVRGLAAGANTTVCVTDPTLRNAGDSVAINVTADCDDEVAESDETNNEMSTSETVVNNGYKGKRYTGGEDLKTLQAHTLKGNIVYSTGDSYYLSASAKPHWTQYTANWNESDIPVPKCATIKKARLYVYYTWDKTPGSNITDFFSLSFNGNSVPPDKIYTDRKGYGSYDYPSGMLAYNVTADFYSRGNSAVLTNSYLDGDKVSMQGMLLAVIYADSSEQKRTIWINEGCDILAAKATYCTTPEEATAYAPFDGTITLIGVESAKLIAVAPSAKEGDDKNRLYFNDHVWRGFWTSFVGNNTNLGINETDVTTYLRSTNNAAKFQDNGDWIQANNAFLVVEYRTKSDIVLEIEEELIGLREKLIAQGEMPDSVKDALLLKVAKARIGNIKAQYSIDLGADRIANLRLIREDAVMNSFVNEVQDLEDQGKIEEELADELISEAKEIREKIEFAISSPLNGKARSEEIDSKVLSELDLIQEEQTKI